MNRTRVTGACGAVAFVLLIGLINAPYRFVPTGTYSLGDADFDLKVSLSDMPNPVMAGWPAKFLIRQKFEDGFTSTSWSFTAAAINFAVAVTVFAACGLYMRQSRKRREKQQGTAKRSFSLADLLLLVFLAAIPLAYWKWQTNAIKADVRAMRQLESAGRVLRQTYVPELLQDHLPASLVNKWSRITCVDLSQPSDEQVQLLVKQPHLRSIRLGGGDYSLDALQYLPSMRFLQDVRIAGRKLDDPSVKALAACPIVNSLNIARTNCNAAALDAFSAMPRLEKLMAYDTSIPYNAWLGASCKEKLTTLIISRPPTGQGGSVAFDGWPRLRTLAIRSLDGYRNSQLFDVRVTDMPALQEFKVDVLQRIDLHVSHAPKLETLTRELINLSRRVADDERAPTSLWISNASLHELPKLEKFSFYTEDFESLRIGGCESLGHVSGSSRFLYGPREIAFHLDQNPDTTQRLIESIGQLRKVRYIALSGQPLDKVDLSPLANNQDIKTLDLRGSRLAQGSLKQLAGLKDLAAIGLAEVESDPRIVEVLNDQFPKFEHARLDPRSTVIHFENKPNLETIRFDKHFESHIRELKLVDVPKLVSPMIVCQQGSVCIVRNAPKMKGLAVLNPQAKISISGVEGLQWYVAGGPNLTTENVQGVFAARGLKRLTLAYPAAETTAYEGLLELQSLEELIIPGAAIDDDFVARWTIPPSLVKLNLDGCELSATSIKKIVDRGNWRELSLSGSATDAAALASLGTSPHLSHLNLSGATVDLAAMRAIGSLVRLSVLDLSHGTLPAGSLALLTNPDLQQLDLTDANFDSQDLSLLAKNNPILEFRLNPADVSVPVMTQLLAKSRVHDPDDWQASFFQDDRVLLGYDATGRAVYQTERDRKSGPEFDCPVLDLGWPRQLAQSGSVAVPRVVAPITRQSILKRMMGKSDDDSN